MKSSGFIWLPDWLHLYFGIFFFISNKAMAKKGLNGHIWFRWANHSLYCWWWGRKFQWIPCYLTANLRWVLNLTTYFRYNLEGILLEGINVCRRNEVIFHPTLMFLKHSDQRINFYLLIYLFTYIYTCLVSARHSAGMNKVNYSTSVN